MSGIHIVTSTILAVVAFGTAASAGAADASLRADLEHIAHQRILFGHQSVGMNLLDGIKLLSTEAGVPVRITEVETASAVGSPMIGHTFIAENEEPLRKLKSFEHAMGPQTTKLDIAFMKFCYVDFTPDTDAKALFARYQATIDGLRARNPGTTFVHVTTPLTIVRSGIKVRLKQLLGRAPQDITANLRRQEYNTLLRKTYQGHEPIFDLARIESTAPDGTPDTVEWNGTAVPVMVPAYTNDGGHLNDVGKRRAARELVSVLASIPDRKQHNGGKGHR